MIVIPLAVAGLAVGSFIGLASIRLPAGVQIVHGRSRCASCNRILRYRDLVPVASFLVRRGRCASCGSRIPARYPLIELGAAMIGAIAGLRFGGAAAILAATLGWWLLLLAILDAEHFWLPRVVTVPLGLIGLAETAIFAQADLPARIWGVVLGWSILVALAWIYAKMRGRIGIGGGDAVLLGVAGAWVGWQGLPWVLLVATWSALGYIALTASRRRWSFDARIPLGSFLAAAIWIVYLARA